MKIYPYRCYFPVILMPDTSTDIPAVTTELYNLLKPLDSSERTRIIKAALMMLGDDASDVETKKSAKAEEPDDDSTLPAKAKSWMTKYSVTEEQLGHVFHIDGGSEVIAAAAPGKNGKEKTINAYVLTGISSLISTGEAKFDDKTAREVCKNMGCLSETNHATYIKDRGNVIGGSKDAGWTLTGPGLKVGADLVKGLAEA
jgi:hypothetical protein